MKKIFSIILITLCICLLFPASGFADAANDELIPGLQESLDRLWFKNNFTQEQMDDMVEQWEKYFTNSFNLSTKKGIITAEDAKTMDLFTRGDMAKIIYEARGKGLLKK